MSGALIRIPIKESREVVDAHHDTQEHLNDHLTRLKDLEKAIDELKRDLGLEPGKPDARVSLPDATVNGNLYVTGDVNFRKTLTAPGEVGGYVAYSPITSDEFRSRTPVIEVHGSLDVTSAISCHTLYTAHLDITQPQLGELYINSNASTQTATLQNTWYDWTTGWTLQQTAGLSVSASAGSFTVKDKGLYYVAANASVSTGTANQDYGMAVAVNNTPSSGLRSLISFTSTGTVYSAAVSGLVTLNAGDILTLQFENTTSAGKVFTVQFASFSILELSTQS